MQAIDTRGCSEPETDRPADLSPGTASAAPALVIDLDRALLRADPAHERLFAALKGHPLSLPALAVAALRGRVSLDRAAADVTGPLDLDACPRRAAVEALADRARQAGRTVVWLSREKLDPGGDLARLTRSDTAMRAPGGSPEDEARILRARHPEGFAYVGCSDADLPLWRAASERFGVDLSAALRRRAAAEGLGIVELDDRPFIGRAALRGMRPHQWLKNLLVFVPYALSMGELHLRDAGPAVLAFICLCALTSGTYLVNDLFDIDADRRHPRKRLRPIASGDLPIGTACAVAAALILGALTCACLLRYAFAAALGSYLVITLAYSFRLKRLGMVDVLVIALLFTLRILAGMLLVNEKPSHWLLMFSIFFFLSLAFMKREVEFGVIRQTGRTTLSGRGYDLDDRLYVLCCGLSSGIASVVIFSLFITATIERTQFTYRTPELLWGVMAMLGYWILRMWMLTTRGLMNDDPILFAARDRTSLLLATACAVLAVGAQVIRV